MARCPNVRTPSRGVAGSRMRGEDSRSRFHRRCSSTRVPLLLAHRPPANQRPGSTGHATDDPFHDRFHDRAPRTAAITHGSRTIARGGFLARCCGSSARAHLSRPPAGRTLALVIKPVGLARARAPDRGPATLRGHARTSACIPRAIGQAFGLKRAAHWSPARSQP